MADVTINDLTSKASPVDGDQLEIDDGIGGSFKTTKAQLLNTIQGQVDANTAHRNGSVTDHSDVTSAGSGQIITGAERTKLNGIEAGAEVNQTNAEIKVQYEANANTNAFTDSEQTKLGNLDANAQLPTGGTAGQILTKDSGTNYDSSWQDAPSGGGSGTYNQSSKDGSVISVNRATLEFRDSGDATVTVTDDAGGDRTIIEVNATAGGGGGGVGAGTPFVVGDLLQVESAAGDGTIQTTGVAVTDLLPLSGGEMTGNISLGGTSRITASTQALTIQSLATQNILLQSAGQIDLSATANMSFLSGGVMQFNAFSGDLLLSAAGSIDVANNRIIRVDAGTDPTDGVNKTQLDAKIGAVEEDTAPALAAYLDIKSNGLQQSLTAAAGVAFAVGEVGLIDVTGVIKANASAAATASGKLVVALESVSAGSVGLFGLMGTVADSAPFIVGAPLYLGTTDGTMTETAPTGSGEIVRVIGHSEGIGFAFFNPDQTWIELA